MKDKLEKGTYIVQEKESVTKLTIKEITDKTVYYVTEESHRSSRLTKSEFHRKYDIIETLKSDTPFDFSIDQLTPTNGRVLIEAIQGDVCKVIAVADNANYEGKKVLLKKGDIIFLTQFYGGRFDLNETTYFLVKPSHISAYVNKL